MNKFIVPLVLVISLYSCTNSNTDVEDQTQLIENKKIEYFGNTQGTTFMVMCNDEIDLSYDEITQTLHSFDLALSSYIPNSILSKLNQSSAGVFNYKDSLGYFNRCIKQSQEVYRLTNGKFDPTVYPLVDGWGFMKDIENIPDSITVDSLRNLVGFQNNYHFGFFAHGTDSIILKNTPNAKLDFNAVAQGLSVDVICELLESKGAKNYMVEIGGEFRVRGLNSEGNLWTIGIDKPIENSTAENRELQEIIQLDNKSIATSGSYRKFYEKNGVKYSHTLDPQTGYPVTHSLLSASVIADNCAKADAFATAFMVMGPEASVQFIKDNKDLNIEVYLIFFNSKSRIETYYTKGFKELILD